MSITVIIPTFNEEVSIGSTVLKTRKHADHVIVVDDGSTDNTAEVAQLAGAEIIRHFNNRGKREALKTGIFAACQNGTKIIITIDTKWHYIDTIPEIVDHIRNNGYDIVVNFWNDDKILNEKAYNNMNIDILACSSECLNRISSNIAYINGSPLKDILSRAKKNKMNIKYLNLEKEYQLNNYNIGVVVPVFNEEKLIEETINGIPKYVKKIYIIDDCSTDKTPEIIKRMKDSRIVSVTHRKNRGVGAAIVTGYKLALEGDIDIVAVMAGDNQMDPEELPKLIRPIIENKADYTKGNRLISKEFRQGMSKWRSFGNALLTMITKIGSGYWHIMDPQNGYTAISRYALEAMDLDSIYTYYGYCNDILIKLNTLGMRVEDVLIPARYGEERSKIKYSKYIAKVAPMIYKGFLRRLKVKYMILDFHPLVFFYFASMILLPFGTIFGMWILFQKLYHDPVSQNYPLLTVFIILMGLQFLLFAMLFDMQADNSRRSYEFN